MQKRKLKIVIVIFASVLFIAFCVLISLFAYYKFNGDKNDLLYREKNLQYYTQVNSQCGGIIKVSGTNINYPVFTTNDNEFYLTHNYLLKYSNYGSIFTDFRTPLKNNANYNTLIYGHDMFDKTMFGQLSYFKEETFFLNNQKIYIETIDKIQTYKIFSCYVTKDTLYFDTVNSAKSHKEYFDNAINRNIHKQYNIAYYQDYKFLTLVTCNDYNKSQRLIVQAILEK